MVYGRNCALALAPCMLLHVVLDGHDELVQVNLRFSHTKKQGFRRMTSVSGDSSRSSLAVLAAGWASPGLPTVLFERSAATSSDSRIGSEEATFEERGSRLSAVHISVYHR